MPNSIFANARASALEHTLLGAERLSRMTESASAEDAMKILQETGFGDGQSVPASEAELLIGAEEKKLAAFIRENSPDKKLTRFLLAEHDFRNAEAVMRAKHLRLALSSMTGTEGAYPLALLEEKIFADDYGAFGAPMRRALMAADELFVGGGATGRKISVLFSRAKFEELALLAGRDKLLCAILSVRADAANIGICLRARDALAAREMAVAGGTLGEDALRILSEESADAIRERMKFSSRRALIEAALEDFSAGRPLVALERAADSAALTILKKEKYSDGGYLPFVRYCCYKAAELCNVQIVLTCLANGADRADIRARLRETYEGQNGYHR